MASTSRSEHSREDTPNSVLIGSIDSKNIVKGKEADIDGKQESASVDLGIVRGSSSSRKSERPSFRTVGLAVQAINRLKHSVSNIGGEF